MRAPVDTIAAPPFPGGLPWINVASLRMDKQQGRPVLVEFWDFARALSVRALPYLRGWHERYAAHGLRVIGVHAPGFEVSRDPDAVRSACARLEVDHPVVVDSELKVWRLYGNRGWPARYLFGPDLRLHSYHLGQGGFTEMELGIQELLGVQREPLAPLHPEDAPDAVLVAPTPDQEGPWSGPYEAGAAWALVDGSGTLEINGRQLAVDGPACLAVAEHERHSAGVLALAPGAGVTCHGVQFIPGVAGR